MQTETCRYVRMGGTFRQAKTEHRLVRDSPFSNLVLVRRDVKNSGVVGWLRDDPGEQPAEAGV